MQSFMFHLTLQTFIIICVFTSSSGLQQVIYFAWQKEWGRQLVLVAWDKLQLLSPAKCKIRVIISNITVEIWSDVDNLKIETQMGVFQSVYLHIQHSVWEARIHNMSAKLITSTNASQQSLEIIASGERMTSLLLYWFYSTAESFLTPVSL